MHVGVQGQGAALQQREDSDEPAHAILAVAEHQGAPRVAVQEVVQVQILQGNTNRSSDKAKRNASSRDQLMSTQGSCDQLVSRQTMPIWHTIQTVKPRWLEVCTLS